MSTTVAANQADPTNTNNIRHDYEEAIVGWYEALQDEITPRSFNQEISDPPQVFEFTRGDRTQEFIEWLQGQQQAGFLSIVNRNANIYVERAYGAGIEHAEQALREEGIQVQELQSVYALPVHAQTLQDLFERNYELLEGITEDQADDIRRIITDGFAQGRNPRRIASDISDSIDHIGINRSRTLARTEVINAHSEATLNRYEQIGIEEVGVQAEWLTAGDRRVCPICRSLAGRTYTIDEVRNTDFRFSPDEDSGHRHLAGMYSKKPPAHPNCRCALRPSIPESLSTPQTSMDITRA